MAITYTWNVTLCPKDYGLREKREPYQPQDACRLMTKEEYHFLLNTGNDIWFTDSDGNVIHRQKPVTTIEFNTERLTDEQLAMIESGNIINTNEFEFMEDYTTLNHWQEDVVIPGYNVYFRAWFGNPFPEQMRNTPWDPVPGNEVENALSG